MKKMLALFAAILVIGFGLVTPDDAEARRFGGGRNLGMQRQMNPQAAPRPAQKPTASPAPQQTGGSKWMGPLAGLAAGGLLAALFMGGVFEGINMMDVLMLAALIGAVFLIVRMLRKPQQSRPAMQYSGINTGAAGAGIPEENLAGSMRTDPSSAVHVADIPADFKVEPFLRNARTSFIRLQAASDAGDLNDIREYTTPEMFAEISMLINERGNEAHRTEVITLDASLLEVATERDQAIASVRFTGQVREEAGSPPAALDEIWHVRKNLKDPDAVWLLAGIQQTS